MRELVYWNNFATSLLRAFYVHVRICEINVYTNCRRSARKGTCKKYGRETILYEVLRLCFNICLLVYKKQYFNNWKKCPAFSSSIKGTTLRFFRMTKFAHHVLPCFNRPCLLALDWFCMVPYAWRSVCQGKYTL